jgi:hypothetical protein
MLLIPPSNPDTPFMQNNTRHADYNTTVNSWLEQRTYVTAAPALLRPAYPALAASIEKALLELETATPASTDGLTPIAASATKGQQFSCGSVMLEFDEHGAINKLSQPMRSSKISEAAAGTMEWANSSRPIGTFRYQTFTNKDFNIFLQDFAARLGDWQHGKHNGCWHNPDDKVLQ